jgi:serine/threonine protein kinase
VIKEVVRSHGFEIIEKIGAGGFGVVYRTHQSPVGRDVAIKVILPDIARDPLFDKRFEKDARLAAQPERSDGVPLQDYWQDEESAYLILHWHIGRDHRTRSLGDGVETRSVLHLLTRSKCCASDICLMYGKGHRLINGKRYKVTQIRS